MILEIVEMVDGADLQIAPVETPKAANVVGTQLGSLEYAPGFGVDQMYFLSPEFTFQVESYRGYLVDRLLRHQVNVVSALAAVDRFMSHNIFAIGSSDNSTGLIK